ncbi:MAG: hypothetical protein K2P44_04825 [Lachnospiraceae bacterium]|nr:hypothetical protein [Lachnospiraceae bacterium]
MGQFNLTETQIQCLKETVEGTAENYLEIANATEELIEASYAGESDIKENSVKKSDYKIEFPIDIELVASHLGMKIEKKSLNREEPRSFSRVLGIITSQDGKAYVAIDNEVSYKTQRYTIANAVGRFLLNQSGTSLKCSYAIPLIPQSLEEIAADTIALFLLLPMKTFKEEFLNYLEGCGDRPLDVDAWLMHLSNKSQISQFNLAIGYQQMKQVLCYQRQLEFRESGFDINKILDDPYDIIFA